LSLERFVEESEKRIPSLKGLSHLELKEEKGYFLLIDEDSYTSEGITSENPVCHVYVGNLETSLEWTTGHAHKVEEIQCRARETLLMYSGYGKRDPLTSRELIRIQVLRLWISWQHESTMEEGTCGWVSFYVLAPMTISE
jgi:hypothetical protein